jgi:predicted DNA-binding transcriptional regulator AlpA
MKPLNAKQVAEELGHEREWLYVNWRRLVTEKDMPRPINGGGKGVELCWSAV